MEPFPLDLFGQVVITVDDVRAWLAAVPHIDPDSSRAEYYVRCWDVAGKIARAKIEGWFELAIAPREPPPGHWWLRFRWH